MGNVGPTEIVLLVFIAFYWLVPAVAAYVVGGRRGLDHVWVAFIPFVGATIVILRSVNHSAWLCLLGLISPISIVFYIWLVFVVPRDHGLTRWWTVPFLIPLINLGAFIVYAFTMNTITAHPASAS
jgi:hypothetical protein